MQTGKWTSGFFLVAAAVLAQTAPQNGKKLSARELFYAETAPPAPAKAPEAKPVRQSAARPAAPAKPVVVEAAAAAPAKPVVVEAAAAAPAKPMVAEAAAAAPKAGPPPTVPARTNGSFSGSRIGAAVVPAAYSPSTKKPLGLRYSFLRNSGGDEYREVDPEDTVFRSGDRIRVAFQSNDEGYLYIVMKGTSGSWRVLFPSPEIADGSNRVASGRQTLIPPPPGRFAFDEQAGEERLFIVLARNPEPSLEKLIYSLGSASPNEPPKQLLTANLSPVDDALVGRLRNQVYARDLVFEKVDDATPGDKKEKAVYVVNPTGSPESRLVADVTLKHR